MDAVEFTSKVELKILSLSNAYKAEFKEKGESCIWKDVYILSEAVEVVNHELTSATCIENIIAALDAKYGLEAVEAPSTGGFGEMTIDPDTDCNVFTIYA